MSWLLNNPHLIGHPIILAGFWWYGDSQGLDIKANILSLWVSTVVLPIAMQIRSNFWPNDPNNTEGLRPVSHVFQLVKGKDLDQSSKITAFVVLISFVCASIALIVVNIIE